MTARPTPLATVVAALLAVAGACVARLLLNPLVGERVPFITFLLAMFLVAWWGGWRPTLLATVLGALALSYFILEPLNSFRIEQHEYKVGLALYIAISLAMGWVCEKWHIARSALEQERATAVEERERLRVTLASIGDGVIVTNGEGCVTLQNAVAELLTGWTTQEARGKRLEEIFHIVNEDTRRVVEDPCAKVLRTGKIVGLANHTVLIARDGTERPIDDSAAPILDANGKIAGVVVVFRDVTKKREDERALSRSERDLADFFENAALPLHSVNADGRIIKVNQAELEMLGYTREECIGRHIAEFHADRELIDDILARLLRGEVIHNIEARLRHKDGSILHVLITSSGLWEDGKFLHTRCFTRDITDRKRAEQALEFLADASNSLSALLDHESAIQQVARLTVPFLADWCVIHAVNDNGDIQLRALAHRDPQQEERLAEMLRTWPLDWDSPATSVRAMKAGRTLFIEEMGDGLLRSMARDERHLEAIYSLHPRSIISVPLMIRERTIGVLSLIAADASRHYTERDVQLAENLAHRAATAIDNARLFQATKESSRQKDEFLAMLAHELRNPLAAIRYAVAIGQMPSSESTAELFDIIDRQTQNLSHLIDDLLDVSRISRDKITLRKEAVDVGTIIKRAVATVRPALDQKKHELSLDIAAEPMPLHVDPTRVEQIVANLLTNASKYTPESGQIAVRAHAENVQAVIRVADNGVGLPPEMLARVFDLFAQADRSLDRSEGGLGIGLTIARKLAEMHGGSISAASEGIGQGSEFTVRIPLTLPSSPVREAPLLDGSLPQGKLRILVVDDNRDTANFGAKLLTVLGHDVQVAHDGLAAIEAARAFRPQAIFLDIGLPGMNGYEVVRKLRADGFAQTRIVAVSGYGQLDDKHRSQEAGFDLHLVKPVDQRTLLTALSGLQDDVGESAPT